MFVSTLKRIFIILLISVSALSVKAQQIHFVYLQTENSQPFYVKLNNKVISSSPAGYVILPNLTDGDYQLLVGFPKNEFPEEDFKISIDKKNEGFLLKNFGEKGWGLFNMQSLALLPGTNAPSTNVAIAAPEKVEDDPFSKMLANVVKDSSILQKHEPVFEQKDTPVLQNNIAVSDTSVNKVSAQQPSSEIASITKLLNENDKEGTQMIYVVRGENNTDTVRVFIPAEKAQSQKIEEQVAEVNVKASNEAEDKVSNITSVVDTVRFTITPTVVPPKSDTVTLVDDTIKIYKEPVAKKNSITNQPTKIEHNQPRAVITIIEPKTEKTKEERSPEKNENKIIVLPKVVTSSTVNSDCKAFANDEDFLKLRKKMAAETNNNAMIRAAKKVFRAKCFSTEQIKNLSYLFLTDEGKYMFFDAAYPFASDSDLYQSLVSQLSDEYYIKRFNAMIHK